MIKNIMVPTFALAIIAACGVSQNKRHGERGGSPQEPSNPYTQSSNESSSTETPNARADGTITSGGGYVYGYETNPWFLGNVSTVRYCVEIDDVHFGISRSKAEASIVRAIDLWKESFKTATFVNHQEEPLGTLVIGTQDFDLVDCSEGNIDLRFQLGTLTSEQKKLLGDPRRFVASTVQQNYDEEQMRGRGFIYVAPETGDLRPDADDLANNFWRYDEQLLLDITLVHELGHVFGLAHNSTGKFPMGTTLCEDIVTNGTISELEELKLDSKSTLNLFFGGSDGRSIFTYMQKHLFRSERGFSMVSASAALLKNLHIDDFDYQKENMIYAMFANGKLEMTTYLAEEADNNKWDFKKVRPLSVSFEQKDIQVNAVSVMDIRVPKNQKIMRINESRHDPRLGSLTASYSMIELLKVESKKITGFMTDPKGKKTFTVIELPNSLSESVTSMTMSVVADGELIQLN